MGVLRLRERDLRLAYDDRALDAIPGSLSPEALLEHCEKEIARRDIRLVPKSTLLGPQWQALTTTFPRTIRTGEGYGDLDPAGQGLVLIHELVHVRQWEIHRGFGLRYLGPRFGLAMELQAYRQSVRGRLALGQSCADAEAWIRTMPDVLWESYPLLRQIRRAELRARTLEVLRSELP